MVTKIVDHENIMYYINPWKLMATEIIESIITEKLQFILSN